MDATGGARGDPMNDTRAARDNRTTEAIAMKDRQIQLLQDQTSQLLRSLDKVGEDAAQLHMTKLAVEEVRVVSSCAGCCVANLVHCPLPALPRKTAPYVSKTLSCSPKVGQIRML